MDAERQGPERNQMFHHRAILIAVLVVSAPASTLADEPNANFVLRLFIDACVPNMGQPEKTRAWAAERHLQEEGKTRNGNLRTLSRHR